MEQEKRPPNGGGWSIALGCALISVGCAMIYLPAGAIAAGALLVVFGVLDTLAGGDGDV